MPKRPCIECGTPTVRTRCPRHEAERQRKRNARRTWYQGDWPKVRAEILTAHRAAYGDWCPGYQHPAHPSSDLTVDHILARSRDRGLAVLCRSCNSTRGGRSEPGHP